MKTLPIAAITLLIGTLLGFSASHYLIGNERMMTHDHSSSQNSKEPLYWVAPMDPNYRRDRPGKSPMGMDLIPVYAEEASPTRDQPGTVHIDPAVENNLGVKTANVEFSKLSPRIETVGYIAFDESQLWQTNVRVSGWVEKLYINAVGEKVNKGDVLFTLYSPELIKAQEELLNAKRTGRDGLIQGATERLISLGVDRDQIRQLIRRGKASQTIEIKALANGVIASLNIREGGFLSPAQAVISAGPLEEVWVEAEVFERQAHWISKGSQATMTLDSLPGREWQGEVDYVYPILDPKTRTLRMRLKFTNPNGELKPNMFANLTLQPISDSKVLTVPKSAVIRSGGMTRVVLAQGQGKYRSVRIKTGQEAGDKIEILQGLTLQDRIVTSAHFMLDSESSQRADLSRIHGIEAPAQTVWAKGEITDIMLSHQMLTLVHQPIPEWNWPGMTMNFTVAQGVDLHGLSQGQAIEFEMEKTPSDQYQIIAIKADDRVVAGEVWIKGDISMLMADFGMVTLSHLAVPEWNWEAGELNFSVGDEINLSDFKQGEKVQFLVARNGSDYVLKQLKEQGEQL
ncbi:Co/Zn/Cd efflux system membrane fusion protein [Vibrio cincinnatiensis]|uniref:Membrane fusion protein, Cu(I)/Ag(I) efflux system n=1 Tax=Vibrio cincinnatiensis DSM 19608 TaxID=1123491 RepID=A0A1T4L2V0_VIBCI|nr:efflux RND transporter periplasmic adaptor subunit [Vibrio cincinnatiensis]SJZ49049.1 membrane fusion protein, Cu(I)/Ag(I) efflux system [Vibrio cincinnatiensis DSM 19608]SUP48241.1 Co/Zn/Cd efflux system membrane fusion protein [Vibrio cincinnatiensis]